MNLRIQTWGESLRSSSFDTKLTSLSDGVNVMEVLRKGLDDLSDMCDAVEEKFTTARDEFNEANPDRVSKR